MARVEKYPLSGKSALITGASRGIGRAIAGAYARAGAKVFLCARREADLERAGMEIRRSGGEVQWLAGDVSKVSDVKRIVKKACDRFGAIDVLVNNASILGPREPLERYPLAHWNSVMQINLTALFIVTKEILNVMIPRGQGSIVNVSSGVGRVGKARWGAYAVSKFGVEGFTQILADEMREAGIRVNSVNPGGTRTAMRAQAYPKEDPLTLPTPDEVTGVFLYLASDASADVTGKSLDAREWADRSN